MRITKAEWNRYKNTMSQLSDKASKEFSDWANQNGGWETVDRQLMAEAAWSIASKYSEGSSALAAQMYDAIAQAEGVNVPPAELAADVDFGELAKAINGALKHSTNDDFVSSPVGRSVKQAGADTMLKNASRDRAEFAWIPSGDSCAFCLVLASKGWTRASKKTTNGDHASHIHTHCDCQFAIRFNPKTQVEGYNPEEYQKMYYDAEGKTSAEKIKSLQSTIYQENKDKINAQKGNKNFKNTNKNGKIIIDGDVFVPCLKEVSSGKLVDTLVEEVNRKDLKGYNTQNGWYINWNTLRKDASIYKLTVKGSDEIQGLIGLTPDFDKKAMYIDWAVTGPQNNPQLLKGKPKKYDGVGGHLLAIAAEKSFENNFDGFAYGFAANEDLVHLYENQFGALWVPVEHPYEVIFNGNNMKKLLEVYNYEWKK